MISKVFLVALGAMLFALCVSVQAQHSEKIPRIGLLMSSSTAETTALIEAFRQGMRELGYIEGKTMVLEIRGGGANLSDLQLSQLSWLVSSPTSSSREEALQSELLKMQPAQSPLS